MYARLSLVYKAMSSSVHVFVVLLHIMHVLMHAAQQHDCKGYLLSLGLGFVSLRSYQTLDDAMHVKLSVEQ